MRDISNSKGEALYRDNMCASAIRSIINMAQLSGMTALELWHACVCVELACYNMMEPDLRKVADSVELSSR